MAEGIQFSDKLGGCSPKTAPLKSSDKTNSQDTFMMLMQLMFPTPVEMNIHIPEQVSEIAAEEDHLVSVDGKILTDDVLPESEQETDAARLALILNWLGYASSQGDVDGEDNIEDSSAEARVLSTNSNASQVVVLSTSAEMKDKAYQGSQLTNLTIIADDVSSTNVPTDNSQILKQATELSQLNLKDIPHSETGLDKPNQQSQPNQLASEKQVLSEQLLVEMAAKKLGGQASVREGTGGGNDPSEALSTFSQLSNGSNALVGTIQTQASQASPKVFNLQTPVTHQDWSNQFNQQIVWLSQQQIKGAIIRLNPKDMGALEVSLQVDKNHAVLQVTTHHDSARDMIEQSLPRLREMLHEQGIQLDDVNVQTRQQEQGNQTPVEREANSLTAEVNTVQDIQDDVADAHNAKVSKGIIDYFA